MWKCRALVVTLPVLTLLGGVTLTVGAFSGQDRPARSDGDPLQALLDEYDRVVGIQIPRRTEPGKLAEAAEWARGWIERVDRVLEADPDHPRWFMARNLQYIAAQKLKRDYENPDYATPKRILREMIRRSEAAGRVPLLSQMDLCSECYREWDRLCLRGEARPADADETYDEAVKMQRLIETHWDDLAARGPWERDHYQELRISAIRSQAAVLAKARKEYLRAAELYLQVERVIVEHFGDPPPAESWVEQQRETSLAAAIRCYALGGRKDLALQVLDEQFVKLPSLGRKYALDEYFLRDFPQFLWPDKGPDYQQRLLHFLNSRPVDDEWLFLAHELALQESRSVTTREEYDTAIRAFTRVADAYERHPELTLKQPTMHAYACARLAELHFARGNWQEAKYYALENIRIETEHSEKFQPDPRIKIKVTSVVGGKSTVFPGGGRKDRMKDLLQKLPAEAAPAGSADGTAAAGRETEPVGDQKSDDSDLPSTGDSPASARRTDPVAAERSKHPSPRRTVEGMLEFRVLASSGTDPRQLDVYHERMNRGDISPRIGVDQYGWFEIAAPVLFLGAEDADGLTRDFEKLRAKATAFVDRHGGRYYVLAHLDFKHAMVRPGLGRWRVKMARVVSNPKDGSPALGITLDTPGAVWLGELFQRHRGRVLAILLDDRVIAQFTIDSPLLKEVVIGGIGSQEEVSRIVSKLNAVIESATTQPAAHPIPASRPAT